MEKERRSRNLVLGFLESISSKVFSDYPKEITALVGHQHGVYALYKGNRLYYVGLATNLRNRVKHHLQDKHSGKWDKFSLYLVRKSDHIRELEALILRIADPKGNSVKGKLRNASNLSHALSRDIKRSHDDTLAMLGLKRARAASRQKGAPRKRKGKGERGNPPLAPYAADGFLIRATVKGQQYTARVRRDGKIRFDGNIYNSPSNAGTAVVGRSCNGWAFWRYKNKDNEWVRLNTLRKSRA
jgi:hypothetical protein